MGNKDIVTVKLPTANSHIVGAGCLLCGGPIPVLPNLYKDIVRVCDKCKQK